MDLPPVSITLAAGASPSPETTAFPFFFTDRALARSIYDGVVVAESTCGVDVGSWWWRGKLGVEGVEYADRGNTSAALLSLSGLLWMGRTDGVCSWKG
jgi:hypothetical protein